jgi:hypothetical protein
MIIDGNLQFATAQAVTATAAGTVTADLGPRHPGNTRTDIGTGEELYFVVQVTEAVTADGNATVTFTLESADNSALSTNPTVHFTTPAIGKADLTLGATPVVVRVPAADYRRWLGARFTVGTGPLTAGRFHAFITKDVQKWRPYARGYVNAA